MAVSPVSVVPGEVLPHVTHDHAHANGVAKDDAGNFKIPDTFLGTPKSLRIIVIGMGASAINLAHILGQQGPGSNITLQCYDKNPEVGGTWYENV